MRKQPQLNLEELLHFRWQLGGGLALLSIWTVFYLESTMWPVAMLATGAILLCLLQPGLPARVPSWMWKLGVPVITAIFALDLVLHEMIPAFVRLNVLLVLHRAVSYRTRREDLQLAVLCLFLIIVTGVLTVSLVFAVQILLFTGLAMVFLFAVNIVHAATDDEPVPPHTWALISRKRLFKRLWDVFDLRLVSLGTVLFLTVVAVSSLIFLSIPRFQMDSALSFLDLKRTRSLTGFSDQIALGEVTHIAQDNSIAMRVDVQGTDIVPPIPYWRMVVLDAYERGMFRVSNSIVGTFGNKTLPVIDFTPPDVAAAHATNPGLRKAAHANAPRYVVFLEGGISRFLPLPSRFRSLHFKETQDIQENDIFRTLSTPKQSATLLSYMIEGAEFTGAIPDHSRLTGELRLAAEKPAGEPADGRVVLERDVRYPDTTRRVPVSEKARAYLRGAVLAITGGETLSPEEFARRACEYLANTHRYSLSVALPPDDPEEDTVVRWMRSGSSGHCEFFAAAFILLSRTAGIPARAITGFKGGTWNAYENYYMVRNSDAHAWCEIFDGNSSWLRVDPTPGGGGVAAATDSVPLAVMAADHSMHAYLDSLRMLWYRRIVNFDERSQKQVAGSLRDAGDRTLSWLREAAQALWSEFHDWSHRPWTLNSSGDFLFLATMLFLVTRVMKRFGIGSSDLLTWLRTGEAATRRRAGELLRRVRLRLAEPPRRGSFDPAAARIVEGHLACIRYGRMERWPAPLAVFRAARRML